MKLTRRSFLYLSATGSAVLSASPRPLRGQSARTRLIILGSAGGPTPKKTRAAPSQVIIVENVAYVVDCGNGVARQLVLADVPLRSVRHVFITHHHSDHNADYGTLLLLSWSSGLKTRVDTWGPPPLARITKLFFEMSQPDLRVREVDEGKPPLQPLVHPHELSQDGPVMEDERMKVRCATVEHPLVERCFAYRFEAADRSIVISGDCAPSSNLIRLARGADILVHEVIYPPTIDAIAGPGPEGATLKKHLLNSHTPVEEAGKIASQADVKTLVLSHFVPSETPPVSEEEWLAGARKNFSGRIIVARDLMVI